MDNFIIKRLYTPHNDHHTHSHPLPPSKVNMLLTAGEVAFIKHAECQAPRQVLSQGLSPQASQKLSGVGFGISILQVRPMKSCDTMIYNKKSIFDLPPGVWHTAPKTLRISREERPRKVSVWITPENGGWLPEGSTR